MAKKVIALVNSSYRPVRPPLASGRPALGQHGVNIMEFCKAFNERTKSQEGTIIPALITIFSTGPLPL